jgi:hypothetical protein
VRLQRPPQARNEPRKQASRIRTHSVENAPSVSDQLMTSRVTARRPRRNHRAAAMDQPHFAMAVSRISRSVAIVIAPVDSMTASVASNDPGNSIRDSAATGKLAGHKGPHHLVRRAIRCDKTAHRDLMIRVE